MSLDVKMKDPIAIIPVDIVVAVGRPTDSNTLECAGISQGGKNSTKRAEAVMKDAGYDALWGRYIHPPLQWYISWM